MSTALETLAPGSDPAPVGELPLTVIEAPSRSAADRPGRTVALPRAAVVPELA